MWDGLSELRASRSALDKLSFLESGDLILHMSLLASLTNADTFGLVFKLGNCLTFFMVQGGGVGRSD